jgi:hypothetical protein
MTTSIIISGQIGSSWKLRSALPGFFEEKRTMFNGFELIYKTKKEAVAAIREAYNSLCADEPEFKNRLGGVRANASRTELYYDASKAIVNQ